MATPFSIQKRADINYKNPQKHFRAKNPVKEIDVLHLTNQKHSLSPLQEG